MSAFAFFDLMSTNRQKNRIAEYVFGFHVYSARKFERSIVDVILSCFIHDDGRLKLGRLFLWSAIMSPICIILGDSIFLEESFSFLKPINASWYFGHLISNPKLFILVTLLIALMSVPFDIWNIYVAKRIYWKKNKVSGGWFFIVDLCASLIPVAIMVYLFGSRAGLHPKPFKIIVGAFASTFIEFSETFFFQLVIQTLVYAPLALTVSVLITFAVRILVFFLGIVLRTLIGWTRINQNMVLISRAHEFPFTFLGAFAASLYIVINMLA